jgi:signal transduction histidine kinase
MRAGLTALLIAVGPLAGAAEPAPSAHRKNVLVIYDEDLDIPGLRIFDERLKSEVRAQLPATDFITETLGHSHFPDPGYLALVREHWRLKYAHTTLDLVVVCMEPALQLFAGEGRLFPGVPIVFCGAQRDAATVAGIRGPISGVFASRTYAQTLELALKLQPQIREVVVVGGTSPYERLTLGEALQEVSAYADGLRITDFSTLGFDEILERVRHLSAGTIVIHLPQYRDGGGRRLVPREAAELLAQTASVPTYSTLDHFVGTGIVGGEVWSMALHATATAGKAVDFLRGVPLNEIDARPQISTRPVVDLRALRRWGLSERALPSQTEVRFKPPTLWTQYGWQLLATFTLAGAFIGISASLGVQLVRRRILAGRLRRADDLRETLFETVSTGLAFLDAEGKVLAANGAWKELAGTSHTVADVGSNLLAQWRERGIRTTLIEQMTMVLSNARESVASTYAEVLSGSTRWYQMRSRHSNGSTIVSVEEITEVKESQHRLEQLTFDVLEAEDHTRRELASDLHDVTGQNLIAAMLNLSAIEHNPTLEARTIAAETRALLQSALREIRTLTYFIDPPFLEKYGLLSAIRWYAEGFSRRSEIQVRVDGPADLPPVARAAERALFRVVQESLLNVLKHAQVHAAAVEISVLDEQLLVTIEDQGHGFRELVRPSSAPGTGVGLASMRQRLTQLGGRLIVTTSPDGTCIQAVVPLAVSGAQVAIISESRPRRVS